MVDPDALVGDILEKTLLIAKADAGLLWEYDPGTDRLFCKAYRGIAREIALSLRLEVGEGLIGKTYVRGTPRLYGSMEEIRRDIGDFSAENREAMAKLFGDTEIHSAYVMPVFVDGRIECIFIVYRAKGSAPFSTADIGTLTTFSGLIEIALSYAQGLVALESQLGILRRCNDLYGTLTGSSVDNSGVPSLVEELSRALEVPVMAVDLLSNERHPRGAPADGRLLDRLRRMDVKGKDPFPVEIEDGEGTRTVYPILAERSCLGFLVVRAEDADSPLRRMLLEVGRMVLAVELSKARTRLDISSKRMAQAFSELVSARDPAELAGRCDELGLDPKAAYAAAVLAFVPGGGGEVPESAVHRVVAGMKKELGAAQRMVFATERRIVALLSAPTASGLQPAVRQVGAFIDRTLKGEGLKLCAGLGSGQDGAAGIGRSFHEAEKALLYQHARHDAGLLRYTEMGVNQVFANVSPEDAASFLSSVLAPLRSDPRQGAMLESTLIAYLESGCSLKRTAENLYIHANTLYKRLKRIEECLDLSFDDPDDLLKLQLARYLCHYHPSASGS